MILSDLVRGTHPTFCLLKNCHAPKGSLKINKYLTNKEKFMKHTLLALTLLTLITPTWAETLKAKLDNGLTVIVREDRRAPVVMSQIWYKIGSMDEKVGKSGLSHALEHMMFKGTPTVPSGEFNRRISALGGSLNAYTSATETVYHENIAKQHLPEILKMEADRMANLNFSDKDFINEMKVIREERRQNIDDNPSGNMYEQMLKLAYDKPANQTAVIGHMTDLFKLKAHDLRDWYKKWYAPNNATVVIVGDVNAQQTIDLVKQTFGHLPAKKLPKRNDSSETNTQQKGAEVIMGGNTKQPMFLLAYRVPTLQKLDDKMPYALDMLANILNGHSAARLDKKFVRGMALALGLDVGYTMIDRQAQLFSVSGMPSERGNLTLLRKGVEAEIALIARDGVSEEELNRAKAIEKANEIYSRDSMAAQASLIGTLEINGFHHDDEAEIRRRLDEVTAQDVQAAAQFLLKQRDVFVQLYPENHPEVAKAKAKIKQKSHKKRK
nr:pitrilysin family protein [Alysiella crassa]UOP06744.1 insulinase family protein [Alysiella crassa]